MSLTQINKAGLDEIALDHVFTIGASGSSAYTFQGEGLNGTVNNPTLYLTRGKTYRFENGSGGHPIRIQSTSGASGTAYNTGVTNNAGSGTVIVEVQHDAPDVLYYQCTSHAAMNGILYVTGALADGSVTEAKLALNAVTNNRVANGAITNAKIGNGAIDTAKLQDDAVNADKITAGGVDTNALGSDSVTTVKILNANVTTAKIADDAVTTQKIANNAVTLAKLENGTSSNDGKFLRANNGADPSFETITGTTINNNADNRVITGSGTANTLNGESNLTFALSGSDPILTVQGTSAGHAQLNLKTGGTTDHCSINFGDSGDGDIGEIRYTHSSDAMQFDTNNTERMRIDSSGNVGIGITNPVGKLNIQAPSVGGGLSDALTLSTVTYSVGGGQRIVFKTDDATYNTWRYAEIGAIYSGGAYGGALVFRTNNGSSATGLSEEVRIQAGGGISFNGDTTSANALDDYEEGTWTPDLTRWTGSAWTSNTYDTSPTSNIGLYTKIGNVVYVTFDIQGFNVDSYTDGRYAGMNGLPFTSTSSNGNAGHIQVVYSAGAFGTNTYTTFWVSNNSTTTTTVMVDDNGSHNTWQDYSGSRIRGMGFYFTS